MKTKILYLLIVFSFANLTVSAQQYTCGIFTFDAIITPPTCNGECDGSIQIYNLSGGTPPYFTLWPNGDTTPNPSGLCSGDYTVFISDNVGDTCSMILNVPITPPITFSLVVTNVSCYGFSDGSICAIGVNSGTPPYIYSWDTAPIQATPCATNLSAGTYSVCVTDSNGCTVCQSATVLELAEIQVTENVTDASCPSCCDGEIVLFPSGGSPPYWYQFTPSGSSNNLCPDTYNWCVTDVNGCSTCDTVVVSFPTSINIINNIVDFSIYPNPNNGNFSITHNLKGENYVLEIVDVMGKVVHHQLLETKSNDTSIDVHQLSNGIYFVTIFDNQTKEQIIKKLILQR